MAICKTLTIYLTCQWGCASICDTFVLHLCWLVLLQWSHVFLLHYISSGSFELASGRTLEYIIFSQTPQCWFLVFNVVGVCVNALRNRSPTEHAFKHPNTVIWYVWSMQYSQRIAHDNSSAALAKALQTWKYSLLSMEEAKTPLSSVVIKVLWLVFFLFQLLDYIPQLLCVFFHLFWFVRI